MDTGPLHREAQAILDAAAPLLAAEATVFVHTAGADAAGTDAAGEVTAGWAEAAGRPADNIAYWDIVAALATPPPLRAAART
jgi:hypothetical protein